MGVESWIRGLLPFATGILLLGIAECSSGAAPAACGRSSVASLRSAPTASQASLDSLAWAIRALIDGRDSAVGVLTGTERAELQALYQRDNYNPLWIDATGRPSGNARDALALLRDAADEGLDAADYHPTFLGSLKSRLGTESSTPAELARFDVTLSSGMARYLRHLHMGRVDPRAIGFRVTRPHGSARFCRAAPSRDCSKPSCRSGGRSPTAFGPIWDATDDVGAVPVARERFSPCHAATIHEPQSTCGERYASIGIVSRQLLAFGDLLPDTATPTDPARYEGTLVDGVKRFQVRHGLEPDGVLGKGTQAALRVPIAWRVRQIELALERLRWLPHLGDERLIALNIPMFRLWAWDVMPPNGAPVVRR